MSNFFKRALTGFFFVVIMVAAILSGATAFFTLFFTITLLSLLEFYKLAEHTGHEPQKALGVITGSLCYIIISLVGLEYIEAEYLIAAPALFCLLFAAELYRKKMNPFGNIAYTLLGVTYIAVPFGLLSFLAGFSAASYDPGLILGFFILVWVSDTGAYVAGKLLGKRKLLERVSPGKTWEGAIGGVIFTLAAAYILSTIYEEILLPHWLVTSVIISVFGTIGDLSESLFKRSIGIKDSGTFLPGHGGFLDRFDAVLLAAPAVVGYLYLFG